jgi:hypothetical protein
MNATTEKERLERVLRAETRSSLRIRTRKIIRIAKANGLPDDEIRRSLLEIIDEIPDLS